MTGSTPPRSNTYGSSDAPSSTPTRNGTASTPAQRAQTIIDELRTTQVGPVPAPRHDSAKTMDHDEVEALLEQFVSEKLAHAHLSAQIDTPTRQSIETMAAAWMTSAQTLIEAVRRVDREDPPTSFWEMQTGGRR